MSDLIKSLPETPALLAAFLFAFLSTVLLILKIMKEYRALTSEGDTLGVHMTITVLVTLLLSFFLFLFAQTRVQERTVTLSEELAGVKVEEEKLQSNLAIIQQQRAELEKQANALANFVEQSQSVRTDLRAQVSEVLRTPRGSIEFSEEQKEALRELRENLNVGVMASAERAEEIANTIEDFRTLQEQIHEM